MYADSRVVATALTAAGVVALWFGGQAFKHASAVRDFSSYDRSMILAWILGALCLAVPGAILWGSEDRQPWVMQTAFNRHRGASLAGLLAIAAAGVTVALLLASSHAAMQRYVRDYCAYRSASAAQLHGCEAHVLPSYVDARRSRAALFARGTQRACGSDAGPLCRNHTGAVYAPAGASGYGPVALPTGGAGYGPMP